MATTQNATRITLTVTDKAAAEVRKFMAEEHVAPETAGLRVVLHRLTLLVLSLRHSRPAHDAGLFARCAHST